MDKCPNTPKSVKVDVNGCPIDSDGDGIPDYQDKCPNTPYNVKVDANGCPLDSDGDGIPDYKDKCPDSPKGVKVDKSGCPFDSDADGVADYLDKCPDTPKSAKVDKTGCPLDTDADGVADYIDKCPDTAKGVKVDASGCPVATDQKSDSVKIQVAPPVVVSKPNPELKPEKKKIFEQTLQNVLFDSAQHVIKPTFFGVLNKVVKVMIDNPTYQLEINGHADIVGSPEKNLILSQNRAEAVKHYLVRKGIAANRLTAKGYGQAIPIADNATKEGRSKNRRVEFKVIF